MNSATAALARIQARISLFDFIRELAVLGPLPTALRRRRCRLNMDSATRRSLSGAKGLRP